MYRHRKNTPGYLRRQPPLTRTARVRPTNNDGVYALLLGALVVLTLYLLPLLVHLASVTRVLR